MCLAGAHFRTHYGDAMSEQTLKDQVSFLINVEKKSVREAADAVGRDPNTIKKLIARESLRQIANPDKGGRKPLLAYPILSEEHRALGIRMNHYRELQQKWNLDEMARTLGLNRFTLQRMEQGRWDFTLCQLNKIREMLNLDLMSAVAPFNNSAIAVSKRAT